MFDGWHPQCFCYATPILVSPEEMKAMQDAKNRGESYTPKGIVKDYPEGFKNWVEDNVDKIAEARKRGTAPNFKGSSALTKSRNFCIAHLGLLACLYGRK